ncbi:NAD(P)H-binding protein [Pontixanthobacter aestiaquae]|uniref:NAD(P)H-binding protein n=1 Tax=Pontixanthobacter aestiaquae TaxID=1509367 RepID=A0A844Z7P2_9SPHN|nr:NAD(P)H-binding protein [Pontixanthobacter aestiaquae]MDN3645909.1 NAD(P)H-binding protein [Pontixanthobacter aestiaquae]MXO83097.1 NAD(P)H-binding protein [Pontixanthobacter aestiaquae]
MSDLVKIAIVGATGLIGRTIIERAVGREDIRVFGIARREMKLPEGARMEMMLAEPDQWGKVIGQIKPDVLVSALGTTWNKSGKSEEAFRAVDQDLVLDTAKAAHEHGVERIIAVSSTGADAGSKNFYLRVKGEVERDLLKIGFDRVDIFRPGLLRGARSNDRRAGERLGITLSPLTDLLMHGKYRKYRSISAEDVADAALALSMRKAAGKFKHDNDAILRAAHSLPQLQD